MTFRIFMLPKKPQCMYEGSYRMGNVQKQLLDWDLKKVSGGGDGVWWRGCFHRPQGGKR